LSSLKEFLAEEAKRERAKTADEESVRAEWVSAVDALLAQMEGWLKAADEGGVLNVERTAPQRIREPRLGTYEIGGLRITFGSRVVEVDPNSRYSRGSIAGDPLGASIRNGRIDMSATGHRYMIYRQLNGAGPYTWIIADDRDYVARPLNQSSFEDAIKSLLE